MAPFMEMRNISKTFPGVKALDRVNLEIRQGEVLDRGGEAGIDAFEALPFFHALDAGAAGQQTGADRGPIIAQRGDAAHAGDDDTPLHIMPPLTEITWRVM